LVKFGLLPLNKFGQLSQQYATNGGYKRYLMPINYQGFTVGQSDLGLG
jgi:hypothetical protein